MHTIMKPIDWQQCSAEQQQALLQRPAISASASISETVQSVLTKVRQEGDVALREFSARFDKAQVANLQCSETS